MGAVGVTRCAFLQSGGPSVAGIFWLPRALIGPATGAGCRPSVRPRPCCSSFIASRGSSAGTRVHKTVAGPRLSPRRHTPLVLLPASCSRPLCVPWITQFAPRPVLSCVSCLRGLPLAPAARDRSMTGASSIEDLHRKSSRRHVTTRQRRHASFY